MSTTLRGSGKTVQDSRRADLAKIHMACKQLGLSDEVYRTILVSQCGVQSAGELDQAGRARLLRYFERLGFKGRASAATKRPGRPTPSVDALPLVRRIRAQLISMGRLPDAYADGVAKQMLGATAPAFFEWCNLADLRSISQALSYQQGRMGARQS